MVIEHMDQLDGIFRYYSIPAASVCLVGGSALAVANIRSNKDLDFVIPSNLYAQLIKNFVKELKVGKTGTIYFSEDVQVVTGKYQNIGIADDDLFDDKKQFTVQYNGLRMVRLELELAHKVKRRRPKDIADAKLLEQYAVNNTSWDWELLTELTLKYDSKTKKNKKQNIIVRLAKKVWGKAKWGLANPGRGLSGLINMPKKYIVRMLHYFTRQFKSNQNYTLVAQTVSLMPTGALLHNQCKNGMFMRYDILMRYYTLQLMFKQGVHDDELFAQYKEMQEKRFGQDTLGGFKEVADAIRLHGFNWRYPIRVTRAGKLIDGSHRIACALYFGIEHVPVKFDDADNEVDYGREWFINNGFETDMVEILDAIKEEIFFKNGLYFSVILWPPAALFYDEVEQFVGKRYKIVWSFDLDLKNKFPDFTRDIYAIDDIERWKVEIKLHAMKTYPPVVRVFFVEIPDPDFRTKKRTNAYLSDAGAILKKSIRTKFSPKVQNYIYDIIAHTGDNHEHNIRTLKVLRKFGICPPIEGLKSNDKMTSG